MLFLIHSCDFGEVRGGSLQFADSIARAIVLGTEPIGANTPSVNACCRASVLIAAEQSAFAPGVLAAKIWRLTETTEFVIAEAFLAKALPVGAYRASIAAWTIDNFASSDGLGVVALRRQWIDANSIGIRAKSFPA